MANKKTDTQTKIDILIKIKLSFTRFRKRPGRLLSLDGKHGLVPSSEVYFASLAVDGDPNSFAVAGGQFAWTLEIDLGDGLVALLVPDEDIEGHDVGPAVGLDLPDGDSTVVDWLVEAPEDLEDEDLLTPPPPKGKPSRRTRSRRAIEDNQSELPYEDVDYRGDLIGVYQRDRADEDHVTDLPIDRRDRGRVEGHLVALRGLDRHARLRRPRARPR